MLENTHEYLLDLCRTHLPDKYKLNPIGIQISVSDPEIHRSSSWEIDAEITMRFMDRRPTIILARFGSVESTMRGALLKLLANADLVIPDRIKNWELSDFWYRDPMR